jgi:glycogen debranching enzyme
MSDERPDPTHAAVDVPSSAGGPPSAARRRPPRGDRPTPADPMPGAAAASGVPSAKRIIPPELGAGAIAVLEGRAFCYSDSRGDVPPGSIGGFVVADTRFLSTWVLTIDGEPLPILRSDAVDYYSAVFVLTNPAVSDLPKNVLSVRRSRFVGADLHEEITIHSFSDEPLRFDLRLAVGTDFADLFEIKAHVRDRSASIVRNHDPAAGRLSFRYEHDTFAAETRVRATGGPAIDGDDLVWTVDLAPRGEWRSDVDVEADATGLLLERAHRDFGEGWREADDSLSRWMHQVPEFESGSDVLTAVFRTSVTDLAALRLTGRLPGMNEELGLPAAGLPWFMTLFGRDTLVTALMSMWVGPELARGGLTALALLQGTKVDDFRDEEPGKIAHEYRAGELTQLGLKPHNPYYGNTDATQLWLILLSAFWRWTADDEFVGGMRGHVERALEWIDTYGDSDGDGFVEYQTRSAQGLGNMCWKDSFDGVQFADGRIPFLPIAIAEAQGYAYDAKVRAAELADRVFGDPGWAERLRGEAAQLKERFNEAFWTDDRGGFYAIGLDGDKQRIDSMTSNMGQLLISGIVPEDRAATVVRQLMTDEMFSGWGVRTLSSASAGFNPIGYHVGTIWPHDNAIIATGMARMGFREESNRIALALVEAASYSHGRLPEAFAGFPRVVSRFPVPFPTACSPQAWATAAPFFLVSTMLGIGVHDGELVVDPFIPDSVGRIRISGIHAFGTRWDVDAKGREGSVSRSGA